MKKSDFSLITYHLLTLSDEWYFYQGAKLEKLSKKSECLEKKTGFDEAFGIECREILRNSSFQSTILCYNGIGVFCCFP